MLTRGLGWGLRRQEQQQWAPTCHHNRPLLLPIPPSISPLWQLMLTARLLPMSMLLRQQPMQRQQ